MVKEKLPIVWDEEAANQFKKIYEKILEDSYRGAIKVRDSILDVIDLIPEHPYKYPADKFKINNDGNYRAFELYHYRIAYKIGNDKINILRIIHIKREPSIY